MFQAAQRHLPLVHFVADSAALGDGDPGGRAVALRLRHRQGVGARHRPGDRGRRGPAGGVRPALRAVPAPLAVREFRRGADRRADGVVGRRRDDRAVVGWLRLGDAVGAAVGAAARHRDQPARPDRRPFDVAALHRAPGPSRGRPSATPRDRRRRRGRRAGVAHIAVVVECSLRARRDGRRRPGETQPADVGGEGRGPCRRPRVGGQAS